MSAELEKTEVEIRDTRLKSIIHYTGKASKLNELSKESLKTPKERSFSQCSDCAQMCAQTITYFVRGAAVVVHSPMGCFANTPLNDTQARNASLERGMKPEKVQVVCSNISQNETIYGGIKKLQKAVMKAWEEFHPTAIFIQSSCAAGIVGDDIASAADELAEKLGIPVVPVFCEGFKSKIWSSGFDAAYHGILQKIVKPPVKKQKDLVNIFNFLGSDVFTPILGKLGLRPNYLVPLADVETLQQMSEAACSTHICETLGTYVTKVLEEEYGVPKVQAPAPYGIRWTDSWYREVARLTGKEDIVEELIASEHERIKEELEQIQQELKGKKVYIFAGDSYAHNIASLVTDLGLDLVGITTLHHDQKTDSDETGNNTLEQMIEVAGDVNYYTVCNKQPYEVLKLLKKLKPDLMIVRHMDLTIVGGKLGIPCLLEGEINISAGYDGLLVTGRRIRQLLNTRGVLNTLAEYSEFPYTDWWMEQEDPFYFEKK